MSREWHPARYTSAGEPTMSTSPLVEYHGVYALALIVFAVTAAGDRWGLGRAWRRLPFVRRYTAVLHDEGNLRVRPGAPYPGRTLSGRCCVSGVRLAGTSVAPGCRVATST